MTFEQASEFLSVSRSTLYRWLREGRVPGHKLGRQWRFIREELEQWRRQGAGSTVSEALAGLAEALGQRLETRHNEQEVAKMQREQMKQWFDSIEMAERLIWDAAEQGAQVIHVQPEGDAHQISYRTRQGLERLMPIQRDAFALLDTQWRGLSQAVRDERTRRLFLERPAFDEDEGSEDEDAVTSERLQVRYQKLATLAGERVSLRIVRSDHVVTSLEHITNDDRELDTLRRWARAPHGIVLLAGRSGSGKTTTAYACLSELAGERNRVIFTIEDPVGAFLPGVNQVEIDLDDAQAYRETFAAIFASDLDVLFIASTFAQRHRALLWGTALNAAESGHLVLVQLEAESAEDALERFQRSVERPIDDHLVGVCWQELVPGPGGKGRRANYELLGGPLDITA